MAQPIICDMCGEVAADFMITNVHNGDTMALGAECVGLFAQGIETAADLAQADPETDPETDEPTDEPTDAERDAEARPEMTDAASVAMGSDGTGDADNQEG